MSLRDRLEALIAAEGPLTVAQWMEACLHDPAGGYYATRPALGAGGDFVTAPLVSQMFGELLGLWSVAAWMAMGRPQAVRWVELGPGDGTLIADARRAAARAAPAFAAAADLVLVETSAPLRGLQGEALGGALGGALGRSRGGAPPRWVDRLEAVEGGAPLIVLANEFLDCLPARQFVRTGGGWAERRVGLATGGGFRFGLAPPPSGFAPPPWAQPAPEGAVLELSPAQARLGAELGARLLRDGGAALLVDYGRAEPGWGDTLQALRRHARVDPLADPGQADVTVHADFPAVAAAARAAGAQVSAILSQSELLQRLGIAARAEALARSRPDRAEAIGRQLHRLLAPGEMGGLFKALAITAPGLEAPGFAD